MSITATFGLRERQKLFHRALSGLPSLASVAADDAEFLMLLQDLQYRSAAYLEALENLPPNGRHANGRAAEILAVRLTGAYAKTLIDISSDMCAQPDPLIVEAMSAAQRERLSSFNRTLDIPSSTPLDDAAVAPGPIPPPEAPPLPARHLTPFKRVAFRFRWSAVVVLRIEECWRSPHRAAAVGLFVAPICWTISASKYLRALWSSYRRGSALHRRHVFLMTAVMEAYTTAVVTASAAATPCES